MREERDLIGEWRLFQIKGMRHVRKWTRSLHPAFDDCSVHWKQQCVSITMTKWSICSSCRCTHPIYCNQTFLQAFAHVFNDSKYFVDSPTAIPLANVVEEFEEIAHSKETIMAFYKKSFREPCSEIGFHWPADLNLSRILFPSLPSPLQNFAQAVRH